MRKILNTVLVAGVVAVSVGACSAQTGTTASTGFSSSSASSSHHRSASSPASSADPTVASASTGTASAAGAHAVTVGLGADADTRVQPQPDPGTCHVGKASNGQPLPDPNCTPGTTNPAVTQANIASTICRSGYTSSIRPTPSITEKEKAANAKSYGLTQSLSNMEYDHLISLELGGSPNDPKNLWVEPGGPDWKPADKFRNDKDSVENKLNSLVCAHKVTLADAQNAIANDWTTALAKLGQ